MPSRDFVSMSGSDASRLPLGACPTSTSQVRLEDHHAAGALDVHEKPARRDGPAEALTTAHRGRFRPYVFAVGSVVVWTIVWWSLRPLLANQGVYLVYMVAIASSAYRGGAGRPSSAGAWSWWYADPGAPPGLYGCGAGTPRTSRCLR
jgi:hypothetical protein